MATRSVNATGVTARPLFEVIVGDETARHLCQLASGAVLFHDQVHGGLQYGNDYESGDDVLIVVERRGYNRFLVIQIPTDDKKKDKNKDDNKDDNNNDDQ